MPIAPHHEHVGIERLRSEPHQSTQSPPSSLTQIKLHGEESRLTRIKCSQAKRAYFGWWGVGGRSLAYRTI